jgi:hypothetical protein
LARYVEGRKPSAIAQAQAVNESTVRTRLARGHAHLRESLAREYGEEWALALAPLVAPTLAQPVAPTASESGSAAASSGAGVLVKAALVVLSGVGGFWLLKEVLGEDAGLPTTGSVPVAKTARIESGGGPRASMVAPAAERERVEAPEDAPPPASEPALPSSASEPQATRSVPADATLTIEVQRDGAPLPGAAVWVAERSTWPMLECLDVRVAPPEHARVLFTDGAGMAAFTGLERARFTVALDASGGALPSRVVTAELHAGYPYGIGLGRATVRGTVLDAAGQPRAGAGIQVCHLRPDAQRLIIAALARTDGRGEYEIEDFAPGDYVVVMDPDGRFDGRGEFEQQDVRVSEAGEHVVDFGSLDGTPLWRGRVLNVFGEPFPGTGRLRLVREREGSKLGAPIDASGRFAVAVEAGTWRVVVHATGCPGGGFDVGTVDLPGQDLERDVVVPGARLAGRIVAPAGRSVAADLMISARPKGHDYPAAFRRVSPDPEGAWRLDGLEPGVWVVGVYPGELVEGDLVEVSIAPGEQEVRLDLRLAGGSGR